METGHIVRYSADELAALKSEADWHKVDAMTAEEADRLADEEDGLLPDGWEKTIIIGTPEAKQSGR